MKVLGSSCWLWGNWGGGIQGSFRILTAIYCKSCVESLRKFGSSSEGAFESNQQTHKQKHTLSLQGDVGTVAKLQLSERGRKEGRRTGGREGRKDER